MTRVLQTVEEAKSAVETYAGPAEGFKLAIADELLDPAGMRMALINDAVLAKGFMPEGFEQRDGYRIYSYADL